MEEHMLTTIDNPYDPFTQFDDWYNYDETKGYHSCAYLARIANTSPDLSDLDNQLEIEAAIDRIVKLNPLGIYIKAVKGEANGTLNRKKKENS